MTFKGFFITAERRKNEGGRTKEEERSKNK
jgi:hypothetical protein